MRRSRDGFPSGKCEICGTSEDIEAGLRLVIDHLAHVGAYSMSGPSRPRGNTQGRHHTPTTKQKENP